MSEKPMPQVVVEYRMSQCGDCKCNVNFLDPCAICPNGKWKTFGRCGRGMPPTHALAKNFIVAVAKEGAAILTGTPAITKEEGERRFAICQQCDFFVASEERCSHSGCGCYLKKKTAWRAQRCPEGKW